MSITNRKDRISIIVPIYKVEKYLKQCVDSILAQTYRNIEVILVDDGSPDGCGRICEEYACSDSRVIVVHQENAGLSAARNAGIDIATGSFLGFVDSDDWIEPQMYEKLYEGLMRNNANLSICDFGRILDGGMPGEGNTLLLRECIDGKEMLARVNNDVRYVVAWNKLYKRELFRELRYPEGKIHEDEFLAHEIAWRCGKAAILPEKWYNYRIRENSIMQSRHCVWDSDGFEAFYCRYQFLKRRDLKEFMPGMVRVMAWYYMYYVREAGMKGEDGRRRHYEIEGMAGAVYRQSRGRYDWKINMAFCSPQGFYVLQKMKRTASRAFRCARYMRFWAKTVFASVGADVVLVNLPDHGNLGDHAISTAERQLLSEIVPSVKVAECTGGMLEGMLTLNKKGLRLPFRFPSLKAVCYTGGGFLGDLWETEERRFRATLLACREQTVIVFPQTVHFDLSNAWGRAFFEESKHAYTAHPRLTIFIREKKSYDFMRRHMPEVSVSLVPDMVTMLKIPVLQEKRTGVFLCVRKDCEGILPNRLRCFVKERLRHCFRGETVRKGTTLLNRPVSAGEREALLEKKLREFASARLVVTDRLHAMIFSAITGTPCIAFDSLSEKVDGVYRWLKENEYIKLVHGEKDFVEALETLDFHKEYRYHFRDVEQAMAPLKEHLRKTLRI